MTHEQEHEQQVMATVDECVALAKEVAELRAAAIEVVQAFQTRPLAWDRMVQAIVALDDVLVGAEPAERRNTTAGPVEGGNA